MKSAMTLDNAGPRSAPTGAGTAKLTLAASARLPILRQCPPDPEEVAQMIREAAYFRAMRRGFAPGHEFEDWLAAEREVALQLA